MQDSIVPIRNALKVAKSFDAVRNLIQNLQSHTDAKTYSQILFILFEQVIPSWHICFTSEDTEYLYSNFIYNQQIPLHIRFESITSLLLTDILQDPSNSQILCSSLHNILHDEFTSLLSYISTSPAPLSTNLLIQIIISVPDRLANALQHKQLPDYFLPKNYYPSILRNVLFFLNNNQQDQYIVCAAHLISRICKLGYSQDFVHIYLEYSLQNSFTILSSILPHIVDNHIESIIHYLLLELSNKECEEASKILLDILHNSTASKPLQYTLTNKLFITKSYKKQTVSLLCCLLNKIHLKFPSIEVYSIISILNNIVNIWRDSLFIRNSSQVQHQNISNAIVELLKYVTREQLLSSQLVPKLIQGVQSHLESPLFPVRNQGMIVATSFSTLIDPSNPLKFDDMTIEEEEPVIEEKPKQTKKPEIQVEKKPKSKKESYFDDPDAPFFADEQAQDDNEEEEEDDLPTYNLEDDESDLSSSKVRVPVYLREALPALHSNNENVDQLEKSLNVLEKLIRSKPDDIDEISESLMAALLHLSDQYNLTNFELLRRKSMVALVVFSTSVTVKYLTTQFYKENYNLQQRMDILEVLTDAAKELANLSLVPTTLAPEEPPTNSSMLNIVGHTTKRFTPKKTVSTSKNNFLPYANQFFFPLVQYYDDTRKSYLNLVASDSILLSKLMYTLATFIECIGDLITVDILPIYKSLLDIIWSLRYHEQAHVRKAVLFALLQVTIYLGKDYLLEYFIDEITELKQWLEDSFQVERDEQILQMSISIQQLLSSKLTSEFVQ